MSPSFTANHVSVSPTRGDYDVIKTRTSGRQAGIFPLSCVLRSQFSGLARYVESKARLYYKGGSLLDHHGNLCLAHNLVPSRLCSEFNHKTGYKSAAVSLFN